MKHEELAKLRKEFNRLPIEEKLRRMEYLADYYCKALTKDGSAVVDATKYWPQFEEMKKIDDVPDLGTVTLGDVLRAA